MTDRVDPKSGRINYEGKAPRTPPAPNENRVDSHPENGWCLRLKREETSPHAHDNGIIINEWVVLQWNEQGQNETGHHGVSNGVVHLQIGLVPEDLRTGK